MAGRSTTLVRVDPGFRLLPLVLVISGCTIQQGGTDEFAVMTSGMTTSGTSGETGDSTSSTSSSAAESSTTEDSSSSTSSGADPGPSSSTTDTSEAVCGDGVPDEGEACDDGNDDEFDACTSQCTVPVCNDGLHNGSETDVDCGGTCQGCDLCQLCTEDEDCGGAMRCDDGGQCVTHHEVAVDWVANCPGQAQGFTVNGLVAGTYRATASQSAGTIWLPPHNPPTTGYFYQAQCTGVTFAQMRTPMGVRYSNIATAFNAMVSVTETFDHAGGIFTCWHADTTCNDNDGGIEFALDYVCAE